jgi:hypothetical protein
MVFFHLFKEDPMKQVTPPTRVWNDEATNLLLFPDDSSASPDACPLTDASLWSGHSAPRKFPLSLEQIAAGWQTLLKRLGCHRRVLETVLAAGHPIQLTDNTLVLGFPPQRRFHQELLDMLDYRSCVEEELARRFRVWLSVVTALYPESRHLHHKGTSGKTPA